MLSESTEIMTEEAPKKLFTSSGESLPSNHEEWTLMDFIRDDKGVRHFFPEVEWTCPQCGKVEMSDPITPRITPNMVCGKCYEKGQPKEEIKEFTFKQKKVSVIPEIYRSTDFSRIPYPQRQEVLDYEPTMSQLGIWIVGESGAGKTRSLCKLIDRIEKEGKSLHAYFHGQFNNEVVRASKSDRGLEEWQRKVCFADYLIIDDLFAQKLTERVETTIFEIIDNRISWKRPTIVTTMFFAQDMVSRFSSRERCKALFRRIEEFFKVVTFSKPKQAEMDVK